MVKIWPEIASFNDLKASAIQPHWILGNILNRVTSSFPRILNYFQISKANTHSVQFTPIFPPPHFTTLTHPHAHPRTHAHSHTRTLAHTHSPFLLRGENSPKISLLQSSTQTTVVSRNIFFTRFLFLKMLKVVEDFQQPRKPSLDPNKAQLSLLIRKTFLSKSLLRANTYKRLSHFYSPLTSRRFK